MADWPRTIQPQDVSPLQLPAALQSAGHTGKIQTRSTMQVGFRWREVYVAFRASDAAGLAFLATINEAIRNGTSFTIDHYHHLTQIGGGTGSVLVNGASQTGNSLVTDGWGGTNPVLRKGEVLTVAGVPYAMQVTADVNHTAGAATIPIVPPLWVGSSPADNAAVTYTGVKLTAKPVAVDEFPLVRPHGRMLRLEVAFQEIV